MITYQQALYNQLRSNLKYGYIKYVDRINTQIEENSNQCKSYIITEEIPECLYFIAEYYRKIGFTVDWYLNVYEKYDTYVFKISWFLYDSDYEDHKKVTPIFYK